MYDKIASDRNAAIEATRQQKLKQKDEREKARLQKHLQRVSKFSPSALPQASAVRDFEMEVQGVRYRVTKGGSKLVRIGGRWLIHVFIWKQACLTIPGDINTGKPSPKSAVIAGVVFRRSKNGNLYRATIIKSQRYDYDAYHTFLLLCPAKNLNSIENHKRRINKPCKAFSNLGTFFLLSFSFVCVFTQHYGRCDVGEANPLCRNLREGSNVPIYSWNYKGGCLQRSSFQALLSGRSSLHSVTWTNPRTNTALPSLPKRLVQQGRLPISTCAHFSNCAGLFQFSCIWILWGWCKLPKQACFWVPRFQQYRKMLQLALQVASCTQCCQHA